MAAGGRVLVVDFVVRAGNGRDWIKWLDINMMALPGGIERTADEFRGLFERSGLRLVKLHRTASPVSVLEAARAQGGSTQRILGRSPTPGASPQGLSKARPPSLRPARRWPICPLGGPTPARVCRGGTPDAHS